MAIEASAATKAESVAQIAAMLAVGLIAAAASFTHVHDVAVVHGQPGWLGWADAVVLELMAPTSGLEMRRRKRMGRPVTMPATVLVAAIALSLAAQVLQAEGSVPGWLAAAAPALAFLVMVKYVLARTVAVAGNPAPVAEPAIVVPPVEPVTEQATDPATEPAPAVDTPPAVDTRPAPVKAVTPRPAPAKKPAAAKVPTTEERVAKLRTRQPDITQAQAAKALDISERTLQRYWATTAPAAGPAKTNGHTAPDLLPAGSQS